MKLLTNLWKPYILRYQFLAKPLGILLIFLFFWSVMVFRINTLLEQKQQQQELYAWILPRKALTVELMKQPKQYTQTNLPLLQEIASIIKEQHWQPLVVELQALDSNTVKFIVKNMNFDELIIFLESLVQKKNIHVQKIEVNLEQTESYVTALVVLSNKTL